ILMDSLRLGLALGSVLVFLIGLVWIILRRRKLRLREKQENDGKLQAIQEESKRELEKQEKQLEKLENDRKSQREREIVTHREQEMDKAVKASILRFRQLPRVPFLS